MVVLIRFGMGATPPNPNPQQGTKISFLVVLKFLVIHFENVVDLIKIQNHHEALAQSTQAAQQHPPFAFFLSSLTLSVL